MNPWCGILKIPEGECGEYRIEHEFRPSGTKLDTFSSRTRVLGGHECMRITFECPTIWHKLKGPSGTWMSDLPIEQAQIDREVEPMCGRVLVGGLGIGYVLEALARNDFVDEIDCVELSSNVLTLVRPYVSDLVREKTTFHYQDLFAFLKDTDGQWDWAYYDIWQSDGLRTFFNTVLPLKELSNGKVDDIVCWNESVMDGQLIMALLGRISMTILADPVSKKVLTLEDLCEHMDESCGGEYVNWMIPFFRMCIDRGIRTPGDEFQKLAKEYVRTIDATSGRNGNT